MTTARRRAVEQRLQEFAEQGRLTAENVLEAARDKRSVLHACFTWDDKSAGHQYRLEQARALIRSVRVVFKTQHVEIRHIAYIKNPRLQQNEPGYVEVASLRDDKEAAQDALRHELACAVAALRRARNLSVLFGMERTLDAMIDGVEAMQTPLFQRPPTQPRRSH